MRKSLKPDEATLLPRAIYCTSSTELFREVKVSAVTIVTHRRLPWLSAAGRCLLASSRVVLVRWTTVPCCEMVTTVFEEVVETPADFERQAQSIAVMMAPGGK